ncbi:uncharacterized protein LOC116162691 [Photinus pyralis]|nr:uncharacterized protein LOC116162691 [Photinus pyralis]
MEKRLAKDLILARKSVKQKYDSLKQDMAVTERMVEQHFKPITQPLKQLLTVTKLDTVKTELPSVKRQSPIFAQQTPRTSTPQKVARNLFSIDEPSVLHEPSILEDSEYGDPTPEDDIDVPTLDDLREELSHVGTNPAFEEFLDQYHGLPKIYVEGIFRDTNNEYDHKYGVRYEPTLNKFFVGDSELDFAKEDIVIVSSNGERFTYKGTPGLFELLFKRNPIGFKSADSKAYRDIIIRTSAARRHYDAKAQIQGNGQPKYVQIIKPLLQGSSSSSGFSSSHLGPTLRQRALTLSTKRGGTLSTLQLNNKKIEFVPWNDPNKLVNWLRVLLGSKSAGNTANHNEIIYITEELRNSGIIQ